MNAEPRTTEPAATIAFPAAGAESALAVETTTTDPPPTNETALHPDDTASLESVTVVWGEFDSDPLYRLDKEVLNGDGPPRTLYFFGFEGDESRKVLVEIEHAETPSASPKPPAGPADVTVWLYEDGKLQALEGLEPMNLPSQDKIRYPYARASSNAQATGIVAASVLLQKAE